MPFLETLTQADVARVAASLLILVFLMAAAALWLGLALGRRSGRLEAEKRLEAGIAAGTIAARDDAVRRSRAVLTGQIGEQLAPFFPGFPCDPAEARFVGKPVDFVAFPCSSDGSIREVVFIEVKSGEARLSGPERAIKEAIESGRVRWVEYRLPLGGKFRTGFQTAAARKD